MKGGKRQPHYLGEIKQKGTITYLASVLFHGIQTDRKHASFPLQHCGGWLAQSSCIRLKSAKSLLLQCNPLMTTAFFIFCRVQNVCKRKGILRRCGSNLCERLLFAFLKQSHFNVYIYRYVYIYAYQRKSLYIHMKLPSLCL